MLVQAALNGSRSRAEHPGVPVTIEELARDAAACVRAGARAIHLHPRDDIGRERLDAEVVDAVVRRVRDACGVPVGVTTGAWIEPSLERRIELVWAWREPDYTSVNLSEHGAAEIMRALIEAGIGIEAGVWTVGDAVRLVESGVGTRITRVLVEPGEEQVGRNAAEALRLAHDIHRVLDEGGVTAPRLQHGDGAVTWVLLRDAVRRGIDTRIGLEDTLRGVSGEPTVGNEALVREAFALGAGRAESP